MIEKRKCNKLGCEHDAVYAVCLSLRVHENHQPAIGTAMVDVCEEHKDVKWEELVTDDGWQKLLATFTAIGRQPPNKKWSKLVLVPCDKALRIVDGKIFDPSTEKN